MENSPNSLENNEYAMPNLDAALNERNQQVLQEQADLARHESENKDAAARTKEARDAIEAATNPNIITEIPEHLRPKN